MTAFVVETDLGRRMMHLVMRGYWDQPTFDAFAGEFEKALARLKAVGGLDLSLVDGREFAVQSKTISEQFADLIAGHMPNLARRTASVVPAQLNRLQAERTGGDLAARYFTDMDEALAWLFETDSRAA